MAGASEQTRRVRVVNANYEEGPDGARGAFSLLVVTEDEERHVLEPHPDDVAPLLSLVAASPVLLWDPTARTLVAANLVGDWLPQDWSGLPT